MNAKQREVTQSFLKGFVLSAICGTLFTSSAAIGKSMKNINPFHLTLYIFYAVFSISLPWLTFSGDNIFGPRNYRIMVAMQSVLGGTCVGLRYVAISYLPLGDAVVLISSTPIFTTIIAAIYLKEKIKILHVMSLITAAVGIILITGLYETVTEGSRAFSTEYIYGIAAAFSAVCTETGSFIIMRKVRNVSPAVMTCNSGLVIIVVYTIVTASMGKFTLPYKGVQQGLVIAIGIISFITNGAALLATKVMEDGPVTSVKVSCSIFSSFLLQYLLFDEILKIDKIIGAILVGFSIVLVALSKHVRTGLFNKCS